MRAVTKRIIYGVLLLAWMVFIFVMSAQPAKQSAQLSGGLVTEVVEIIYPNFEELSETKQTTVTYNTTFIVRKAAHFSEYFILGVLCFMIANTYRNYKFAVRTLSAVIFCVLYAVSDEIHQYFVAGRACRFLDICIDTAGSIFAVVLLAAILHRKKRHKSGETNA